jgi:hypothetical protein
MSMPGSSPALGAVAAVAHEPNGLVVAGHRHDADNRTERLLRHHAHPVIDVDEHLRSHVRRALCSGGKLPGAPYSFHILAGWTDASDDHAVMTWARAFHEAMAVHATGGVYVNLLGEDEADACPPPTARTIDAWSSSRRAGTRTTCSG